MSQFDRLHKRNIDVDVHQSVSSTNSLVKAELAEQHLQAPLVMVADEQTAGHGKVDRPFYSAAHSGAYFTLGLPNSYWYAENPPQGLTIRAVVAAFQAAEQLFDGQLSIKWVNDLYRDGKKVAGILAETAIDDHNQFCGVVIGWGMNLNVPADWPANLQSCAGALTDQPFSSQLRNRLVDLVVDRFLELLETPWQQVLDVYRRYQYLAGKKLAVDTGNEVTTGRFLRITDDGYLVIQTSTGARSFSSGTIRLVQD